MAAGDEQDLTRKQRREQAREQRRELEQAQAASAVRRTRLTQLGIVAVIVVAIIVAVVLATGGSKKHGIVKPGAEVTALVNEINTLIGGIPQSGGTLGSPTAPVTLQYFGDLECPICREFTEGALKPLIETEVRPGRLRIEYRSLQTATPEAETFKTQQVAALAAGKQQKAWYYIELFYHQQGEEKTGYVTESFLQGIAQQVPGLNLSKWAADRGNAELGDEVSADQQTANSFGFTGTPSFAMGRTGTPPKKFEAGSFTNPASFESAIESLIKK
jgi:protein-disulfide isomerase